MGIHEFLKSLREGRGLSLADVTNGGGVPRQTVWRAETPPWKVKGGTLRKILSGLGLREGERDWVRAVMLWTAEGLADKARAGTKPLLEKAMAQVSQLPPEKLRELLAWLERQR